jgi:hypothetical protein
MATAAATTRLVRVNHTAQTTGVQGRGVHNVRPMMPLGLRSRNSCVIVRAGGAFLTVCAFCVDSTLVGGERPCLWTRWSIDDQLCGLYDIYVTLL